jgi:hypothetical protein
MYASTVPAAATFAMLAALPAKRRFSRHRCKQFDLVGTNEGGSCRAPAYFWQRQALTSTEPGRDTAVLPKETMPCQLIFISSSFSHPVARVWRSNLRMETDRSHHAATG